MGCPICSEHGHKVEETQSGVYTVSGGIVPIQIVNSQKLSREDKRVVRKLQFSEQFPYETAKYAVFCRICETTRTKSSANLQFDRVVEQVQWLSLLQIIRFTCNTFNSGYSMTLTDALVLE